MSFSMKAVIEELLRLADAEPVETPGLFFLACKISSADRWGWLREARAFLSDRQMSLNVVDVVDDDGFDFLDDDFDQVKMRALKVRIVKKPVSGVLRFLTTNGLRNTIAAQPAQIEAVDTVFVADVSEGTSTLGLVILAWDDSTASTQRNEEGVSPRTVVNDTSGSGLIPQRIPTWCPNDKTAQWLKDLLLPHAAQRLSLSLPDDLSVNEKQEVTASIRGGRKVAAVVPASSDQMWSSGIYNHLCAACKWVYCEARDAETRHALLTAELIRTWPTAATWAEGLKQILEGALEAAKTAYRLHLHEKGVDALKLMSDLRKGLTDDVRSVASQTALLSAGLWRDAAVAFGATALRVVTTTSTGTLGGIVLWITAAYLVVSCYLTCRSASKAVQATKDNEAAFRRRLYGAILAEEEYHALAGAHYSSAISEFYKFRRIVVGVYSLAVAALIVGGIGPDKVRGEAEKIWKRIEAYQSEKAAEPKKPEQPKRTEQPAQTEQPKQLTEQGQRKQPAIETQQQ